MRFFEDDVPFQRGDVEVPAVNFRGCNSMHVCILSHQTESSILFM